MGQTSSGIAYDDRGSGESALLLLPGWCGPRTLFDPATARLERIATDGTLKAALNEIAAAEPERAG